MTTPEALNNTHLLLQQAIDETQAWAAAIMVPDKEPGVLTCGLNIDLPEDWQHITNALDNSTANGRCYLNGTPEVLQGSLIAQPQGGKSWHNLSAIAVIPIKREGTVVANLEVIKDEAGAVFTSEEVKTLEDIADRLTYP